MLTPKTYASKYLTSEIHELKSLSRTSAYPELSIYEKVLVYKYSADGYKTLNEKLRKSNGRNTSIFGKLLSIAIDKLPDFAGLVYRKVDLTKAQQNRYRKAHKKDAEVKEPFFISTTRKLIIAKLFPGNTLFIITSKTGKNIEKIAKFGEGNPNNEFEILFGPKKRFIVLDIEESPGLLTIIMEEI